MMCQSWIRKITRQTGVLPNSFVLRGVTKSTEHPVSGGGFADIYQGSYKGREVALKVLRVFVTEENRKRIHRVSHNDLHSTPNLFFRKSLMKHSFGNI
jgi:hypothetical protein